MTAFKKSSASTHNLQSAKLLNKVAQTMVVDTKVKAAEDEVMRERKQQKKQLKTIKNYLTTIKTGDKTRFNGKINRKTQVVSTLF